MDINLEYWNTQNIIHTSNEVQEERRSGPWFWKDSVKQYSAKPEVGRGRWEDRGREGGLRDFWGGGGLEKGKSFQNDDFL